MKDILELGGRTISANRKRVSAFLNKAVQSSTSRSFELNISSIARSKVLKGRLDSQWTKQKLGAYRKDTAELTEPTIPDTLKLHLEEVE